MAGSWRRLDNAARVFAALSSRRTTTVFRVAVTLRSAVDAAVLQRALDAVMSRFPCFRVRLRTGAFWHYLEEIGGAPEVRTELRAPCRRMTREEDGPWQLRVLVYDRRISVEFSHAITDGAGAMAFLTSLLAEYLAERGVTAPPTAALIRPTDPVHPEEAEDAYRRFYDPGIPPPPLAPRAFRLPSAPLPDDELRVMTGVVPLAPLRELSRAHQVTLTELLASVLLAALTDIAPNARRPFAVMIPVNLRTLYRSRTLRNFFLSVTASIDPRLGSYTFEEILHEVHHSVQGQITAKSISRQIRRNVGAERNPIIRHIPLVLKVPAKRRLYAWRWGARYTTALSNLGAVRIPPELAAHVERFEAIPNPSAAHGVGCAAVGFGDSLLIIFASIVGGVELQRAFFTRLRRMGITPRIETNEESAWRTAHGVA
ncbi:MAG: hypothetical protein IT431_01815 [Phycisphaerales bacterium]|nr:hypothetical protein [Phycisphaerales bacterium]